jgi:hypothetical protein
VGSPDGDYGQLSSGRLAYGCTNLATAWPHGGTGLGLVGQVFVFPQRRWLPLQAEETNSAAEVLWLGGDVVVSFTLEGWDEAAVAVINPNYETSGGTTVVSWETHAATTYPPGSPLAALSNVVFTPWDTTNGKGFIIYSAVAVPDVNAELALGANRFLEIPAVMVALPNSSNELGRMGKFSTLSAP